MASAYEIVQADRQAIAKKFILFCDKEKSQELFTCQGLQLPEAFNNLDYNIIIHKSRNIVKPAEKNSSQELARAPRQMVAAGRGR